MCTVRTPFDALAWPIYCANLQEEDKGGSGVSQLVSLLRRHNSNSPFSTPLWDMESSGSSTSPEKPTRLSPKSIYGLEHSHVDPRRVKSACVWLLYKTLAAVKAALKITHLFLRLLFVLILFCRVGPFLLRLWRLLNLISLFHARRFANFPDNWSGMHVGAEAVSGLLNGFAHLWNIPSLHTPSYQKRGFIMCDKATRVWEESALACLLHEVTAC